MKQRGRRHVGSKQSIRIEHANRATTLPPHILSHRALLVALRALLLTLRALLLTLVRAASCRSSTCLRRYSITPASVAALRFACARSTSKSSHRRSSTAWLASSSSRTWGRGGRGVGESVREGEAWGRAGWPAQQFVAHRDEVRRRVQVFGPPQRRDFLVRPRQLQFGGAQVVLGDLEGVDGGEKGCVVGVG